MAMNKSQFIPAGRNSHTWIALFCFKYGTLHEFVSSLCIGHANLFYIVPILIHVLLKWAPNQFCWNSYFLPINISGLLNFICNTGILRGKERDVTLTRFDSDHINLSLTFQLLSLLFVLCKPISFSIPSLLQQSIRSGGRGKVSLFPLNRWGIREKASNKHT